METHSLPEDLDEEIKNYSRKTVSSVDILYGNLREIKTKIDNMLVGGLLKEPSKPEPLSNNVPTSEQTAAWHEYYTGLEKYKCKKRRLYVLRWKLREVLQQLRKSITDIEREVLSVIEPTYVPQTIPEILPQGWEARKTHYGRIYYVNHVTKTTQWNPPPESIFLPNSRTTVQWNPPPESICLQLHDLNYYIY